MRRTRAVLTRTTPHIGYAFVEGWQVVNGEYVEPSAPKCPVVVGTPEYVLAIHAGAKRRFPTIRKFFVGDRSIDDSRDDQANKLRWLVVGVVDEMTVWLLPVR